jgi:hypothetical protein
MKRSTIRALLSSCLTLLVAVPTLGLTLSLVACKEAAVALGPAGPADVPTQLTFLGGPTNAIAGAALTPGVRVAILDAQGNTVTTATTSVTLAMGANSAGGSLTGTVTESAVYGVATFSSLSIDKADTGYTLSASAAGVSGATSMAFSVAAGTASKLAFTAQPATTTIAGAALTPSVRVAVLDAQGNTVTTATTSVTLAIGTNSAGGSLSGTVTESAVYGVAAFSDLSIDRADTGYTLGASAAGVSGATSTAFSVTVGTASKLAFTAQPASIIAGMEIPAVAVAVQDAMGNSVATSTTSIALTIGTNPVGGTLLGTATVAAIGGVATFSYLRVNNLGTGYTLSASAASLTGAMSTPFSIVPPVAGGVIARESLTAVDGGPLPCCGIDSAGAHVSIVSGVLTFYAATYYPDSIPTPGGIKPRACVNEIPNGARVNSLTSVVTFPDGSAYILVGCSWGAYGLTLSQQLDSSSTLNEATVSAGAFTWKRDTLTIADPQLGGPLSPSASMAGATITVIVRGHTYQFVAIAAR